MKLDANKGILLLFIICSVAISGCMMNHNNMGDNYDTMPCHTMPDGSQMGNCDDESETKMVMMYDSEEYLPTSDKAIPEVKSSTIIDVKNGEEINLEANKIKKIIRGKEYPMYGYNNQIPGPAIRATKNSTITVQFTNNIDMDTTVHWHGLRHNIENDGVPGISQSPVSPGESFSYTLHFPDDGIFWYHPHIREDIQQDLGLAGNILVPSEKYNPVNREELIVLDDILIDNQGIVPYGSEHANFALMGRFGNVMLTNGEEFFDLDIQKGEVIRLYLTNVANVRPFNFSIEGVQLKLVGGDLGLYEREEFVDSVILAPAMRAIVEIYFPESGEFNFMHINPHESYILGSIQVSENEVDISYADNFKTLDTNQEVVDDISQFASYFDKQPDYNLTLDIDMMGMMENMPCHVMAGMIMGDCTDEQREELLGEHEVDDIEWEDEMNMKMTSEMLTWQIKDQNNANMQLDLNAKIGDVIKIRLFNDPNSMHPMQHPIHVHGQRFITTHIDDVPVNNKVWMDTVLVPIGSTVDILVDVTNPGEWMMHCHIAEHLEAGMMTSLEVIA